MKVMRMRKGTKSRIAAEKVVCRGSGLSRDSSPENAAPGGLLREYYVRRAPRRTIEECECLGCDDPEQHFDEVRALIESSRETLSRYDED